MDKISSQPSKKGMFAALAGTMLVALCCFTPILVILLGAAILLLGFSFWKLYLKKQDCSCKEDFRVRKIARGIFWVGAVAFNISASFQSVLIHLYQ